MLMSFEHRIFAQSFQAIKAGYPPSTVMALMVEERAKAKRQRISTAMSHVEQKLDPYRPLMLSVPPQTWVGVDGIIEGMLKQLSEIDVAFESVAVAVEATR